MAEIVEGAGVPLAGFRFSRGQLDAWFDGRVRALSPGLDYPAELTLERLRRRLELAASKREGTARVWRVDGRVHICLSPWR